MTITGTNFGATQGTSTVTFNGTAATPTSWSATSIAVPVPSGATTGNVVVTVGGAGSNGVNFTVTPSITILSPNSGPVGTAVTITGTNFGATQGTSTVTLQRNGGHADELERNEHCGAGAERSDHRQCGGDRRRGGQQRGEFHCWRARIAFVQMNFAVPETPQTSVTVTYTKAQTANDLNVVVVGWNDSTAQISSVADSAGNTYSLAVGPTVQTGTATQAIYYAKNIVSAAANANSGDGNVQHGSEFCRHSHRGICGPGSRQSTLM